MKKYLKKDFMSKSIFIIVVMCLVSGLIVGCSSTKTHNSMSDIVNEGWPAHKVDIDVARISPFKNISYSENTNQYGFGIYDKSTAKSEFIVVVVKSNNINFTPEIGDFVSVKGELQDSDVGEAEKNWYYNKKAMIIYATQVNKENAPVGW